MENSPTEGRSKEASGKGKGKTRDRSEAKARAADEARDKTVDKVKVRAVDEAKDKGSGKDKLKPAELVVVKTGIMGPSPKEAEAKKETNVMAGNVGAKARR